MKQKTYFIIDFDSTFTQVEALDELAKISLKDNKAKEVVFKRIEGYTNLAMEGKLSFAESLEQRVKLLDANKDHLKELIVYLKKKISRSFARNETFFKKHADDVLIVSGGFKEFITPVVKKFHIKKENVYANTFLFDKQGKIIGYDKSNPLSKEGGKVELIKKLNLTGDLFGIGDGYSDFQLRESGLIKKFFAFTENISRKTVTAKADHVTPNFDEFLYINKIPGTVSYPKNRIVCLTSEAKEAEVNMLKEEGFTVADVKSADEKLINKAGILIIGQNGDVDDKLIRKLNRLKVVGNFANQVSLSVNYLTKKGIAVFDSTKGSASIQQRVIDFINKGSISNSTNFPSLHLRAVKSTHRIIHIHHNVPGIMAKVNTLLADHNINIVAQYLMTTELIGYVIIDIDKNYEKDVLKGLKKIDSTIQFRIVY